MAHIARRGLMFVLSSPSGGLTIARSTGSFTIIDDD